MNNKGFGIIEIVVSVAIMTSFVTAFFSFYQYALILDQRTTARIQANTLLIEGVEVVKFLRDESWSTNIASLATSTPYYMVFNTGDWEIVSTNSTIDFSFVRYFKLDDVYRDASDSIASTGTYDPHTKKLTMYVEFVSRGATSTDSITTYITNIFDN